MSRRTVYAFAAALLVGALGCQADSDKDVQAENMFREYCSAWTARDLDLVVSYFADDGVYEHVPRGKSYQGKEVVKAFVKATFDAVPDFTVDVTSVFATGDWIASEWVMRGTISSTAPDLAGAGKSFRVKGSSIVELRAGKILRNADYWDRDSFLRQTGQLDIPDTASQVP